MAYHGQIDVSLRFASVLHYLFSSLTSCVFMLRYFVWVYNSEFRKRQTNELKVNISLLKLRDIDQIFYYLFKASIRV